ncbi:hypothetical protein [Lactobacillus helsingborgensis]|uniref:hypothetical protein n=1 Tax=Lactobacillus helsingborgensis TaxID=1218494 RepID=UPI001CC5D74E|nr:hypothetical protein [Lactobacillus helsingborgensis]
MKFKLHSLSKTFIAAVLLSVPVGSTLAVNNVFAKTDVVKAAPYHYSNKDLTNKFSRAGYVFKLIDAEDGALIKTNGKSYSPKVLQKIVKNNTLFKVKKVRPIHNGMLVDLVSKDGKYKGTTVYLNGIYNKHAHDKKLQPLIKAELSVMTAKDNKKPTAKLLGKAEALANKLTGREKKIALTSIKQVKEFIKYGTLGEIPVLLIGLYPVIQK